MLIKIFKYYFLLNLFICSAFSADIKFHNAIGLDEIPKNPVWSITQDSNGMVWIANNNGLFFYDGYKAKSISEILPTFSIKNIRSVVHDNDSMWLGTKDNGLYKITGGNVTKILSKDNLKNKDFSHIFSMIQTLEGLWFGSLDRLNYINKLEDIVTFDIPKSFSSGDSLKVQSIIEISKNKLFIATQFSTFYFDKILGTFSLIPINQFKSSYIRNAHKDDENNIWIATDDGVYLKNSDNDFFEVYLKDHINYAVSSILVDHNFIWIGTIKNGLLKISKTDFSIKAYSHVSNDDSSIAGNTIVSMLMDKTGVLFLASFNGGISQFNVKSLNFGLIKNSDNGVYCSKSPVFYGIDVENDTIWLSSDSGLIEYNVKLNKCINHNETPINREIFTSIKPYFTFKDSANIRWIINAYGLSKFNEKTGKISQVPFITDNKYINFMIETSPGSFLIGTEVGLYRFENNKFINIVITNVQYKKIVSIRAIKNKDHEYYIATKQGVAYLDKNDNFFIVESIQSKLPTKNIASVYVDESQNIWVGTIGFGVYKFSNTGKLLFNSNETIFSNSSVYNFLIDDFYLWMASDNGLIKMNMNSYEYHVFHKEDGLQDNKFNKFAAIKSPPGKFYFGGVNGFNAFYPSKISINKRKPKVVLTNLTRFGKKVFAGIPHDDFLIRKPVNQLEKLILTHKDYVIGFEFAAIDFTNPIRNKYAFKMEGQDPDWNYVGSDDRKISYSNLKPGEYVFRVKGSNSDGVWNDEGKSLRITVLPAPWLTWWAYLLYVLTFFTILFLYFHKKNKANIIINKKLKQEVKRQTKQLNLQKQKVENLLERKNEMFANVSHEFRTPLTLILGPINQLLGSDQTNHSIESLKMVNRNAKRLLTMVEQFLLLAKMTNPDDLVRISQQIDSNIENIVNSFQSMAEQKNIRLRLKENDEAAVKVSQDAIEIILGNLISNAIKYTPNDGDVTVVSKKVNNSIIISVSDTGCGLNEVQQEEIFKRFNRLEVHQNLPGVGIGLSLVDELVKVNKGQIEVSSVVNTGSIFTFSFSCVNFSENIQDISNDGVLINKIIENSKNEIELNEVDLTFVGDKNNKIILIIDDNRDMRIHVAETLKHKYYCILADRGNLGVSFANKYVPDIIICDVMMPGMDGFTVSRILRSDTKTSHIPLILLTALNDKKSRIKGWRENIDVYLSKPFDADELLVQLENILVIRKILSKKAGTAIKSGKFSMNSGLPKKDRIFVEKFINILSQNFTRLNFLRPEMASLMAVSERQLQRKIKALIGKNPLDLLREFRLEKATHVLKDGYQIGVTADKCGFNTVTYFSKCFKETYGKSPKEYQSSFKAKY